MPKTRWQVKVLVGVRDSIEVSQTELTLADNILTLWSCLNGEGKGKQAVSCSQCRVESFLGVCFENKRRLLYLLLLK